MAMDRPSWVKDKKVADDFEVIRAKPYDDYKDHRNDDGCYTLIRIYWDTHEIGVAICDYQHTILKEFSCLTIQRSSAIRALCWGRAGVLSTTPIKLVKL